jgi:hypothetical protein
MVPPVGRDGEAFGGAPEGAGSVVARQAGVGVDVAGDVDTVWRSAEANDLSVEAHRDVDMVIAGQEEEGVALGAELAMLLDGVDGVDPLLDGGRGHGWIEDEDVGAEVGFGGGYCRDGSRSEQRQKQAEADGWCDLPYAA